MSTFKCIESLEENPAEVFLQVTSILIKLVDNVLLYPSNPKYRKLRLENKLVSSVIMPSIGAMECLFEIGFQEDDDALLLPPESTSIEKLTQFRTEISNRRNKYLKDNGNASKDKSPQTHHGGSVERQSTPQPEAASLTVPPRQITNLPNSTNAFLAKLHTMSALVLQYELENTKRKALSVVPLESINQRVQARMRQHQQQAIKDKRPMDEASTQETIFFLELMDWFKNDFFKWVNSPKCPKCHCDTQFVEMSSDQKELVQTDRVEVYKCSQCSGRVVFPRLNNASLLIDSRKGRCGEWATAFTAFCRALGWEARFIYDETDHVWTEVYFKSERRWVHLDPCECAIDKPLLYEKGWGKQLSYILAFACDHVQDVTWRYSANHSAVLARRRQCSEQQLVQTIQELNKLRQTNVSNARRKALARSTLLELVELMSPAADREGDGEGRQSGSLAWRLARSEVSEQQASTNPYTWTPTPKEISVGRFILSYCSGRDEYCRGVEGEKIKGWKTGVFSAENMFRKEEKDWKTVYLCRTENSVEGRLSWNIDLTSNGLKADLIEVTCVSKTFENGKVLWLLCSGDKCVPINNGLLRTEELRGSSVITLTATVSGGRGTEAWQHSQLFRQPLEACDPAFTLSISFTKS